MQGQRIEPARVLPSRESVPISPTERADFLRKTRENHAINDLYFPISARFWLEVVLLERLDSMPPSAILIFGTGKSVRLYLDFARFSHVLFCVAGVLRSVAYSRNFCLLLLSLLVLSASGALAQATSGPVAVAPIISTVAGMQSSPGYSGDGGPATSATMQVFPYGGVAADGAGNVYIADDANNRIRMVPATSGTYFGQMMTAGDIYTIAGTGTGGYSGDGGLASNARLYLAQNMTLDQAGNLYIADTGNHVIRMVPAVSGTYFGQAMTADFIYTIAGNGINGYANGAATTVAEMSQINGVAVDLSGNIYVADGLGNNSAIRMVPAVSGTYFQQVMTANTMYTIAGTNVAGYNGDNQPATSAKINNPGEVVVDGKGNVYFSDIGNNRVRMVPEKPGNYFGQAMAAYSIYTIAGSGNQGFSGDAGPATSADLYDPKGLAMDSAGNLYISDIYNNRIRMIAAVSGTYFGQTVIADDIYTVAGDGTQGYSGDGGQPTNAELYQPYGVALDGTGNLYIADTHNSVVRKVGPATEFPVTAVGATSVSQNVLVQFTADTFVSGFAVPKTQSGAQEFTVGTVSGCTLGGTLTTGTICTVSVTFSPQTPGLRFGALEAMNGTNSVVGTVGLTGVGAGPLGLFQPGTASVVSPGTYTLNNVGGVAVTPTGDLYIADSAHNRVVVVSPTGAASLVSTGSVALNEPIGLAVDSAGNLFIANTGNGTVAEVSAEGTASLVNLSSITPQINPLGLAEDAGGDLYIADRGNNRIVKVTASGVASVVSTGSLTLNYPNGVGVDSTGNLFIADRNNNRIVEVTASGAASVVVSNTTQFGGTTLNNPSGVAVDSAENIYITDLNNNRLVEYSATGVPSVIATGSTSLPQPHDPVLDGTGDIYIANWAANASGIFTAVKVNLTQGALAFLSSNMGVQSSDSPKSATLQNAGNATLLLSSDVTTVTTAQTSNSFNLDGSTTCGIGMGLNAGDTCVVGVDFVPLDAGALAGFANITDNNLNAVGPSYAVQQIALNGTGNDNMATILLTENPGKTVTYGTAVTVKATLSGSNGIPTGNITYTLDGVSQPSVALTPSGSNGVATFILPGTLSVGTHSVLVNYAGDNNYAASTPTGFTLTVKPDNTKTTLVANPTSAVYGSSVMLTATVKNTSASPNTPVPTGTVTFLSNGTSIGTGTVTNGVATLTTSALPAGTDNLTASYGATTDYAASTSSPAVPVTVSLSGAAGDVLAIDTGYTSAYVPAMGAFQPDQDFAGGNLYSTANTVNVANAINPAPMSIYQTERWGPMTYTIPNLTPGSTYTVRLHFAEISLSGVGQRIFNVGINGTPVLKNFDVYAVAGGANIAITEPFEATADSSGNIAIAFTNGPANSPKISGIEILASQPSTTTLTAPSSATYGSSVTLTATVTGTGFTPSGVVVFSNNGIPDWQRHYHHHGRCQHSDADHLDPAYGHRQHHRNLSGRGQLRPIHLRSGHRNHQPGHTSYHLARTSGHHLWHGAQRNAVGCYVNNSRQLYVQ